MLHVHTVRMCNQAQLLPGVHEYCYMPHEHELYLVLCPQALCHGEYGRQLMLAIATHTSFGRLLRCCIWFIDVALPSAASHTPCTAQERTVACLPAAHTLASTVESTTHTADLM